MRHCAALQTSNVDQSPSIVFVILAAYNQYMQSVVNFRQRWSLESQLSYFGSFSIFQLNFHYFL